MREFPAKHGARLDGYDTYWACCSHSKYKGLNGVCTIVRAGLAVCADAAPLNIPALDTEGRCVEVDVGCFVILNVYVPNDGPAAVRLPVKMRFLTALKGRMDAIRASGRKVVLAGDLNIARRNVDRARSRVRVPLDELLLQGEGGGGGGGGGAVSADDPLARVKRVMVEQWAAIEACLAKPQLASKVVKSAYKGPVTK